MSATIKSKETLLLLGHLVAHKHPAFAGELLDDHNSHLTKASESDKKKIPEYFLHYCNEIDVEPGAFTSKGSYYNRKVVEQRRIFICIIIDLYCPELYVQPKESLFRRNGYQKTLSTTLNIHHSITTRTIKKVILMQKIYEEFRVEADRIKELIYKKVNHVKA